MLVSVMIDVCDVNVLKVYFMKCRYYMRDIFLKIK